MTESLLLAALGGALGLALGYLGRNVIPLLYHPRWSQGMVRSDFDGTVIAFAVAISLATGVLFGIFPAWQCTRMPIHSGLKRDTTTRRRRGSTGRPLVLVQVALSMLLVVCAVLFGATLRHLYEEPLGFDAANLYLFDVSAPSARHPNAETIALFQRMEGRLSQIPGVISATLTQVPVLGDEGWDTTFQPIGRSGHPAAESVAMVNSVGVKFFDTYRIPLLSGRGFRRQDDAGAPPVAVANQALAEKFWPRANAVGQSFRTGPSTNPLTVQIIGVVGNAKYSSLSHRPPPTIYFPYRQANHSPAATTYAVRSRLTPSDLLPKLRAAVAGVDPDLALHDFRTQREQINATTSQQRTFAVLAGAFGVLALVLACIGIYGLTAYDVARRTSEIGVRKALGARTARILVMILREAGWMAAMGIALGLGASLWLSRFVKSMLYELPPNDPWVLVSVTLLLLLAALLAGLGPALRAARVEPMIALRHE